MISLVSSLRVFKLTSEKAVVPSYSFIIVSELNERSFFVIVKLPKTRMLLLKLSEVSVISLASIS